MATNHGLWIIAVEPVWTSVWGGRYWQLPLNQSTRGSVTVSRHHAAAVVIGRRGLGHRARRRGGCAPTPPAGGEGLPQRLPEPVTGLGEAADDGGDLEVQQAGAGGDGDAGGPAGPCQVVGGDRVAGGGGGGEGDAVGGDAGRWTPAGGQGVADGVGARGDRLDTASAAARARRPVGLDDDVAEVAAVAAGAGGEVAVEDQAAADAGGDGDAEQVAGAGAGAFPVLADGQADGVVVDQHPLGGELLGQPFAQWEVAPRRDVQGGDVAGRPDHGAAGGDADAVQVAGEGVGPAQGGGRAGDQGLVDRLGVGGGGCGDAAASEDPAGVVDHGGGELGAADVQRQDGRHRGGPPSAT